LTTTGVSNFVKASTAETSTQPAAWSTYADAAGVVPVDCTGGSANITWTRNTTTPLRGAADFKLTKDGSNRQGQGVSYAFTTGPSDGLGELLTVSMPVKANEDAAYATGDIAVYVYNVTGAALITPTITNVEDSAYQFVSQFNLASSSSYRLCIHVASSNASAYDVYFDDITVGLQKYDWPGQINLVNSPIDATGWVSSGAGVTVATSTTSTDLPLGSPYASSAIKITPVSGTSDYARTRFYMPAALASTKLKAEWYQRPLSGYASGDLKVDVYSNSVADCSGSFTRISLSTDSSSVTGIPNATGKFTTTFDTDGTSVCYEIRYTRTAGTTALNITNVVVGPGIQPQGAVIQNNLTMTGFAITNLSTSSSTASYTRFGQWMLLTVQAVANGAASGNIAFTFPSGFTIDSSVLSVSSDLRPVSVCLALDNGTARFTGDAVVNSTTTIQCHSNNDTGPWRAASPMTWASGDVLGITAWVPIAEWAGSGTVNLAQNTPEYVFNTSVSDADDSSSFGYGPAGNAVVGTLTALRQKRVRFQTPIQPTDSIWVEINASAAGNQWMPVADTAIFPTDVSLFQIQNASSYGVGIGDQVSGTDVDIYFGQYSRASGATYASAGLAWGSTSGVRWRVVKAAGGQAVGFGNVTQNSSGLVTSAGQLLGTNTNDSAATGYVGQYKVSTAGASNFPGATAQWGDATSLSLEAGDWDVTFVVETRINTATGFAGETEMGISATSGNSATGLTRGLNWFSNFSPTGSANATASIPNYRVSIASTTTYYAKLKASYSGGNPQFIGSLIARRVR
jgi:hypothetical protein